MPEVIDCPACNRKLRLPEDLRGRLVQCPTCGQTFAAPAPPDTGPGPVPEEEPAPVRQEEHALPSGDQPLRLALDPDNASGPARKVPPPPLPLRAVPLRSPRRPQAVDEVLMSCPSCGRDIDQDASRCRFCEEDLDADDRACAQAAARRRAEEPHRGPLILSLGILSLVLFCACGFLGLPLGIAAWVLGHNDLEKIRAQRMDPEGRSMTKSGYVCGVIGTILDSLWLCLLPRLLS